MAAPVLSPEILTKIKDVTSKTYSDQAIFYLNAFWAEGAEAEAETVWGLVEAFIKEDHIKGKNGNELNMTQAFSLLQKRDQTLTALQLKTQLRTVDIDANGEMALAEYLLFINKRDPVKFIKNPQGAIDPELIRALEEKMAELDRQFQDLQVKQDAAVAAEAEAKRKAEASKIQEQKAREAQTNAEQAAAAAKKAEDAVRAIQSEAEAIAAEIAAEEKKKADEIARLEALSTDQSVGIVKRNMAVQQLASAKGEDPLPLRKAKLTQDAVVRRLAKATDLAAAETAKADEAAATAKQAADDATAAREASEVAAADAARAVEEVKKALKAVQDSIAACEVELEELKNSPSSPMGELFWKGRELLEKKKSLPMRMW